MANKKPIGIAILVLLFIIGATTLALILRYRLLHENNLAKTQVVGKFTVSGGQITEKDGFYTYTVILKNPSKRTLNVDGLVFTFYDKDNKRMTMLYGYVEGGHLKSNESVVVMSSTDTDLTNANRVKIDLKK